MAAVFGLQILDRKMSTIAARLLQAHAVVIVLGLMGGILECVEHFSVRSALDDLRRQTGKDPGINAGGDDITVFLNVVIPLVCPLVVFLLARNSILTNSRSNLQGLCFLDGCCVFCTGWGVVVGLYYFFFLQSLTSWVTALECGSEESEKLTHRSGDACELAKDSAEGAFGLMGAFQMVSATVSCCQLAACTMGTWQANQAVQALIQQHVFCPHANAPHLGQVPGQPSGGTVVVVGQPMSASSLPGGQPAGPQALGQPVAL